MILNRSLSHNEGELLKLLSKVWLQAAVVTAGLTLAMTGLFLMANPDVSRAILDVAVDSPQSRWYSLQEIGIEDPGQALAESLAVGEWPANNAGNLVVLDDIAETLLLKDKTEFITLTERWEHGGRNDARASLGYPAAVLDTEGSSPTGEALIYYAIHDVPSGIALTSAIYPQGPFTKLADQSFLVTDSRVLRPAARPRTTSHFSSPVVIWNETENLWFMYFHYYSNEWQRGRGHQRTALATSESLRANDWEIVRDEEGRYVSVLPTTPEFWMNSQSTYHAIVRLPGPLWIAFLRGVGGSYSEDGSWNQAAAALGFAVSRNGRQWAQVSENPQITQPSTEGREGVFRPLFLGRRSGELVLCWSESEYYDHSPVPRCGATTDLRQIRPIEFSISGLQLEDGPVSSLESPEGRYLYQGRFLYRVDLPVLTEKY